MEVINSTSDCCCCGDEDNNKYVDESKENCLICNNKLEYLEVGKEFICDRCGRKEIGYIYCNNEHYICDDCHNKSSYEIILDMSLKSKEKNPLLSAEKILKASNIPMLGCEHALITVSALLSAIRNQGDIVITDEKIIDAFNRTKKQAIAGYCGLTGVCGIAPAVGASFSVILGAACPKDKETAITMHVVAKIVEAIANETGPCCCKNFMRTALSLSSILVKEYLEVEIPIEIDIKCEDSYRNPHGCRTNKCKYFNKKE